MKYRIKDTSIVVEIIERRVWDVVAKRLDNGKIDSYPLQYAQKFFVKVKE